MEEYVGSATAHISWAAFPEANRERIRSDVRDIVAIGAAGAEYAPTVTEYLEDEADEDVLQTSAREMARRIVTGSDAIVDLDGLAQTYHDQGIERKTARTGYTQSDEEHRRMSAREDDIRTAMTNAAPHYERGREAATYRVDAIRNVLGESPLDAAERHAADKADGTDAVTRARQIMQEKEG